MWECRDGMTPRSGQVGVSCLSLEWRDDIKEWTSGGVVPVTRMAG